MIFPKKRSLIIKRNQQNKGSNKKVMFDKEETTIEKYFEKSDPKLEIIEKNFFKNKGIF